MKKSSVKIGREKREKKVKVISGRLTESSSLILNDYRGLTVSQISELRRLIAPLGATMHVQKNKLVKIAMADNGYPESLQNMMNGPIALAYVQGDVAAVLKQLIKLSKKDKFSLQVMGAYADGMVFDKEQTETLSKLPPRDQLLAQLMSVMNAPTTKLAASMNDVVARLARVMQAVADNK